MKYEHEQLYERLVSFKKAKWNPTQRQIASRLNIPLSTLHGRLKVLEDEGLIVRKGKGNTNHGRNIEVI